MRIIGGRHEEVVSLHTREWGNRMGLTSLSETNPQIVQMGGVIQVVGRFTSAKVRTYRKSGDSAFAVDKRAISSGVHVESKAIKLRAAEQRGFSSR